MNSRELFAAHCPPVPKWYAPKNPKPLPDKPLFPTDCTPAEKDEIKSWTMDPIWDLPEKFSSFQAAWSDYMRATYQHECDYREYVLFTWPWYYADNVISNYHQEYGM